MLSASDCESTQSSRKGTVMTMSGKQVQKKSSGGKHGAANQGVGKASVKGKPGMIKVGKGNATGGGPGGGF